MQKRGLRLHLDGARIFNALVETGDNPQEIGSLFDSISICLSTGTRSTRSDRCSLAAVDFIAEARRVRKVMGGGMRQAGYLAAAGIYALDYHVDRLKEDHAHARVLAQALSELSYVGYIRPVQTNIVIFDLHPPCTPALFLDYLNRNGIAASAFGPQTIRFVTHLDVSREMIDKTVQILRNYH
jgi:threonine aldolase